MAGLWNRAGIIFLPCGFFFLLFFPSQSQPLQIGCLPCFHTWCGLSANLRCRSELYCTRLAGNAGRKKSTKSPSGHHRTTLSGYIFATKAHVDSQKNFLSSNISSTCPQNMVNFSPLAAEIGPVVWGTPANFNGFQVLASLLTAATSLNINQPNFARCLAVSWAGTLHFRMLLLPDGNLPRAKFTLRPSLAFW